MALSLSDQVNQLTSNAQGGSSADANPGQNMLGSVLSNTLYQQLMPLLNNLNARRISNVITGDKYYNTPNVTTGGTGTTTTGGTGTTTGQQSADAKNLSQYNDVLTQDYQKLFGRAPDTAGEQYWANQLASGAISPNDLLTVLGKGAAPGSADATAYAKYLASQGTGGTGTQTADAANLAKYNDVLRSAYEKEFQRDPDIGGEQYWANQLASGAVTPDTLMAALGKGVQAGSSDAKAYAKYLASQGTGGTTGGTGTTTTTTGTQSTDATNLAKYNDVLTQDYNKMFNRNPDVLGEQYWANQLASGAVSQNNLLAALQKGVAPNSADAAQLAKYLAGQGTGTTTNTTTGGTTEVTTTGGTTTPLTPDAANLAKYNDVLTKAYQTDFDRAPDVSGEQYWANQLASGSLSPTNLLTSLGQGAPAGSLDAQKYAAYLASQGATLPKRDGGSVHFSKTNPYHYQNGRWHHG